MSETECFHLLLLTLLETVADILQFWREYVFKFGPV
jgi:hypothetical protein